MSRGHPRTTEEEKVAWLLARRKEWEGFPQPGEWPRGELEDRIKALTRRFHRDLLSPTTYRLAPRRGSLLKHVALARRRVREERGA